MTPHVPAFTPPSTTHSASEDILTLQDHVTAHAEASTAEAAAHGALLNAITENVARVKKEGGGLDFVIPRLKQLSEAYALVVHGKKD
jgi:hypothetical protein